MNNQIHNIEQTNKPSPYEVYMIAKMLCNEQICHPSNRDGVTSYVSAAIILLKEASDEIDKVFNKQL